ncbi:MAG: thioredoxin domain-containing protein [Acidobacteriota bacterium]|nr:thioredoxin domain-containing protein [Acidobacteriota bacterium]
MPNRLALESSPYLRQHAHNPVDWYPWGEEAFEKARRENRPVFLSIGYSSCHWCHVMEKESFENDEIARFLNAHFVSIKVDREERPDVDDVYMTAVQLTSGRGGWPLSAFLLPDRKPFFAGTYFPPDDRRGRPGFLTLLKRLEAAWREKRADLENGAGEIAAEVAAASGGGASGMTARGASEPLSPGSLGLLGSALSRLFDPENGGFGDAPKFPPHLALAWLLRRGAGGDAAALAMAEATLEAMALGGIRDHLGGGFHRYSTDAHWLLPHFEKMLTDNAQLLGVYARAWALTGDELFAQVARETADYLLREMTGPEGGFYASTDADSEGEEGRFFCWDQSQIREILGKDPGEDFCEWYGVREGGNFSEEATGHRTGASVLFLSKKIPPSSESRLAPLRAALLAARAKRIPPALDDKRIAGWIALAVSGLAVAGRILNEVRYLDAARAGARFLLEDCRDAAGQLQRTWKDGVAKIPAFLEDEAFLVHALLDLAEADDEGGPGVWQDEAIAAAASMRARFERKDGPGFAFSGEGNEVLLVNARDFFDKATPSSSGAAAWALARLALRTGDAELARGARNAVDEVSWLMARSPHGTESWYFAYETLLEFEDRFGLLPLADTAVSAPPPAGPGKGEFSLKVNEAKAGAGTAEERDERTSSEGAFRVTFPSKVRARRGATSHFTLAIHVAEGWHLQGPDGLRIDASVAGPGSGSPSLFTFEEVFLPVPVSIENTTGVISSGWHGTFEANLSFSLSPKASKGRHDVAVRTRYRACGEGTCLPEALLSLSIPVEIV